MFSRTKPTASGLPAATQNTTNTPNTRLNLCNCSMNDPSLGPLGVQYDAFGGKAANERPHRQLHAILRQRVTSNGYSVLGKEALPSLQYARDEVESSVDRTIGQMDCDPFLTSAVRTLAIAAHLPPRR